MRWLILIACALALAGCVHQPSMVAPCKPAKLAIGPRAALSYQGVAFAFVSTLDGSTRV
jgi:hypothetical protein